MPVVIHVKQKRIANVAGDMKFCWAWMANLSLTNISQKPISIIKLVCMRKIRKIFCKRCFKSIDVKKKENKVFTTTLDERCLQLLLRSLIARRDNMAYKF